MTVLLIIMIRRLLLPLQTTPQAAAGNAIIGLTVLGLAAVGYIIYTRARER